MTKLILSASSADDDAHALELERTGFWGKEGAGCLVLARDTNKFLLQQRSEKVLQPYTWGVWGGAVNQNESTLDAALRELREEAGDPVLGAKISRLWVFKDPSGFKYTTFLVIVPRQFTPVPDAKEVSDWGWFDFYDFPKPLHTGFATMLLTQQVRNTLIHACDALSSFSSLSSKQLGLLYHATSKENALQILRTGDLILSTGRAIGVESKLQSDSIYFASLTRSRVGAYHYGEDGSKTNRVIFTLDGTALSQRYKIKPVDYWHDSPTSTRSEAEERLLSDKRQIPITKYIKRVDFIVPAIENIKDPKVLAQRGKGLSSLVFECKKSGIPYAFYTDARDWSRKLNAYSPLNLLPASSRPTYVDTYDYKELRQILEALRRDPKDLNGKTDAKLLDLCRHPDQAYVTYTNNTRVASGPIMVIMNKISRLLKRLGIKDAHDFNAYLKSKYDEVNKRETRDKYKVTAEGVAESLIRLMTVPRAKLQEKDLMYLDPKYDDLSDTKISYYLDQYVQDFGHTPITQKAYTLLNANSLNTHSVLSEVRYVQKEGA